LLLLFHSFAGGAVEGMVLNDATYALMCFYVAVCVGHVVAHDPLHALVCLSDITYVAQQDISAEMGEMLEP
jgi:hypothetical protein